MLDLQDPLSLPKSSFANSASFYSLPDLTSFDEYMQADANQPQRLTPVDFKQLRYSLDTSKEMHNDEIPRTSKIENEPEAHTSSTTPFMKHHRRKSSNLRAVSSFTDCREPQ